MGCIPRSQEELLQAIEELKGLKKGCVIYNRDYKKIIIMVFRQENIAPMIKKIGELNLYMGTPPRRVDKEWHLTVFDTQFDEEFSQRLEAGKAAYQRRVQSANIIPDGDPFTQGWGE